MLRRTIALLILPLLTGCLELLPSAFQDLGPLLGPLLGQAKTYVIVGDAGTIYRSADGLTWTKPTLPGGATNNLNAVVWNGVNWIVVGTGIGSGTAGNAVVFYSSDGTTWTKSTTVAGCDGATGSGQFNGVVVGGGRVVAVGASGAPAPCVSISTDNGVTWTTGGNGGATGSFTSVKHSSNQFVAVATGGGRPYTSADGSTFAQVASTPFTTKVSPLVLGTFNNTMLISGDVGSTPMICRSTDNGTSWPGGNCNTAFGGNGNNRYPRAAASNGTRVVLVGDLRSGAPNTCYLDFTENLTSFSWLATETSINSSQCPGVQLNGLVHDGSKFIAVGASGNIGVSPTGGANDWTFATQGTNALNAIAIGIK